jgi:hypothetical protein
MEAIPPVKTVWDGTGCVMIATGSPTLTVVALLVTVPEESDTVTVYTPASESAAEVFVKVVRLP